MFGSKTLFVVGAGASKEAELPTGNELTDTIVGLINIQFEHFSTQTSGDEAITAALFEHVKNEDGSRGDINPHLHACWHIRDAMPHAISIDNFIDSHYGDHRIELCGKLAIVRSILMAERKSLLFIDRSRSDELLNFSKFHNTWYHYIMQRLTDGCQKTHLSQIFDNISFIIFNYNRCIQQFLYYALQNYFRIPSSEAKGLLSTLKVFHPYGTTGLLPWQTERNPTEFGGGAYGTDLLTLANGISTFTERVIPTDVSHDSLAHFRRVMEASRSGMARRSFQALQQASTMAS